MVVLSCVFISGVSCDGTFLCIYITIRGIMWWYFLVYLYRECHVVVLSCVFISGVSCCGTFLCIYIRGILK